MQKKTRTRIWSILLSMTMLLSLLPVTALAAEPESADGAPTANGTNFFANGTSITITADAPSDATEATLDGFTAEGTDAYISWNENGTTKYIGVGASANKAYVFGGADGRTEAVSVESTSITMTGGTIWRLFGGNYGEEGTDTDFCSVVEGDVSISLSGNAVVKDLLHGAGARNTCVNGTITMEFDGVDLSDSSSQLYVNGGSWGNGNEGTRNIADGTMDTDAVASKVIIKAEKSKFYLLGGGGSGSTKVLSSSVTLNNCELNNLYLGGINGEVEDSSIVANGCTIAYLSATNRGFVGTANVDLNDCTITKLNTGAANGCFSSDSGGVDGSGVTGRCVWDIDADTTVEDAQLTPLVMKNNGSYTNTYENLTVQKAGTPLELEITAFVADENNDTLTQRTFAVPEGSTLTLKGVNATVTAGSTLTNVGTINMDDSSSMTVASGATFGQLGTVNGGNVVNNGGTINDTYVARIGTTGYASLQDAVNAVSTTEPTTITLLKDASGNGVIVPSDKNMTFDLNNCTYTIDGTTVGSTGTETNGFQLLKNSTVTFKNGTITSDKAKILIQNYSNLTLDNVTLDGTNLNASAPYTLSNNFGNTRIKDTTILAATNGYAFDLYYWPQNGYGDGVSVTVEGDSQIKGNIQYGSDNSDTQSVSEKAILNITGGTFTGSFSTYGLNQNNETGINISGGTFAQDLSESGYLADAVKYEVGHTGGTFTYAEALADAQAAAKPGDTITDLKATTTYTLTLDYNDNDATPDSVYKVEVNTKITLPTPTRTGYYTFLNWSDGTTTYAGGTEYTVSANATLTAQWSYNPPYTGSGSSSSGDYLVSVESSKNGTVTVSPSRADKGDTVTITVKPDAGYELDTLTVTDKDGDSVKVTYKSANKYTFTMPGSKVTIEATFAEISEDLPFTDVAAGAWYADAVQFVYENGLMAGITATTFGPNVTTSRAMLATILYRLEGEPNVTAASFTDVESGMYYTDAVAWASSKGIVTGYGDGTFLPNKAISREEMAAMLYRYASYKGYDVTGIKDLGGYSDAGSVSSYAVEALQWATGAGLVTDMGDGTLSPTGLASRAQIATILMRFLGE